MDDNIKRMNVEDSKKYIKRCQVLQDLVMKKYRDQVNKVINNDSTGYCEIHFKIGGSVTILLDTTWEKLKTNIDLKLEGVSVPFCKICSSVKNKLVACNNCSEQFCTECYIDSFRKNKGIVVCEFCQYSFGIVMSDEAVEDRIEDIRDKIDGNK